MLEISSVLLWVTYAPISNIVQHYFHEKSYAHSITAVNMLANIFYIMYAPGTIIGNISIYYQGIRSTFLIASTITALGAFLRYVAAVSHESLSQLDIYWMMFLGQALSAFAQPFLLNMPATISCIWFPVEERDIATTVGAMVCPLGLALGQVLPVLLVTEKQTSSGEYRVQGMDDLLLAEFVITAVPVVLTFFFFTNSPPNPPSKAAENKLQTLFVSSQSASNSNHENGLGRRLRELLANKHYLQLFLAFSVGVGFFYTLLTLLNQLIQPVDYTNNDAGTFGAVFIVFGLIGSGVAGYIMEKTKAYRILLKVGAVGSLLSAVFLFSMLFRNNFFPLLFAFAVLGFFALPLLPVMMENSAEVSHPISEDLSVGGLYLGGNLLSLGFIFIAQGLLSIDNKDPARPWKGSGVFLILLMFLAFLFIVTYYGPYHRMEYEKIQRNLDEILIEDGRGEGETEGDSSLEVKQ